MKEFIKGIVPFFCLLFFVGAIHLYDKQYQQKQTYGYYKHTLSQSTSPAVVSNSAISEKKVFLTFDDGPSEMTEKVLDCLDENSIKATFFLIGEQITEDTEELVRRMYKEGHEVGVHTYTHEKNEIYASAQAYIDDVIKTADRIREVTGKQPVYYRFPWGSANCYISSYRKEVINALAELGFQYIDWNVSGEDSVGTPSSGEILSNIKKDYNKYQEPVVLMHDSSSNKATAQTLSDIVSLFSEAGYSFGAIGERSRPYQWKVQG